MINSNRKNSKTCKIHENMANSSQLILSLMSGSCHLDSAANVEIGVECQIFVIVIFFNCDRVLQFGALICFPQEAWVCAFMHFVLNLDILNTFQTYFHATSFRDIEIASI